MSQGRHSTYEIRTRAVEAVVQGLPIGVVGEAYGVDRTTLFRWLTRYYTNGKEGLCRRPSSGRPRLLEDLTETDIRSIVLKPASSFEFETDLWTVGRLQQVIEDVFDVRLSKDTVWRRLRDAGLTYQKPERQYFELDEEAR